MKYEIQIDESQIDESQEDEISTPRQDHRNDRTNFQSRKYRNRIRKDSQDFEAPKRNDSKCSMGVIVIGILTLFIIYLVHGFLREPSPPSESKYYRQINLKYNDFGIGNLPLPAYSDGYFSTNSLNLDARRRILQRMICHSHKRSFCFHKYPAEVIEDLVAVSVIYTPTVSKKTALLYNYTRDFQSYMQSFGLSTCLLESTTIEQEFVMTKPNNEPYFIQLKNDQHFFKRENLLNVAIKKIMVQTQWQIFAWIDAHQIFSNHYWWEESIIKAHKVGVIQLFQAVEYLSPQNETTTIGGPASIYKLSLTRKSGDDIGMTFFGNAWAISRDLYEKIGYIYDEGIGGSTDYIFTVSTQNNGPKLWKELQKDNYFKTAIPWLKKVAPIFNNTVSSIRGKICHFEHERTFLYSQAMDYIRRTYENTSLLEVLQRKEDFSLFINDSNFKRFH